MDGVYHATIVSARSARALLRQAEAVDVDEAFRRTAVDRAVRVTRTYDEGVAIVEAGAMLTPSGQQILDESKRLMARLRPRLPGAA